MRDIKIRIARLLILPALCATLLVAAGCSSDDTEAVFVPETPLGITDYGLTEELVVTLGRRTSLIGNGFQTGDKIVFRNTAGTEYETADVEVFEKYIEFSVDPGTIGAGPYTVLARRGTTDQLLGNTTLRFVLDPVVPEKTDMNIRGMVYCGIEPLSGVVVSDGVEFAVTDSEGFYYLNSDKKHGYVFITIPSGYMPLMDGSLPLFWKTLEAEAYVDEVQNFELSEVDNSRHIMLFTADLHLCDRNNDLENYESMVVKDVRNYVATLPEGVPVYSMSLGDMSWDTYWTNGFTIRNYIDLAREFPVPIFHTMGNHDNDPNQTGDFNSEIEYKLTAGPTYYSMDIGDVHYVVLDNIYNDSHGTYYRNVTREQYDWLVQDLSYVKDKSAPLVVCMHSQTYYASAIDSDGNITVGKYFNGPLYGVGSATLSSAWAGFDDVTIMSGHVHINRYVPKGLISEAPNTRELNIGAAGGTWWWSTVYTPLIICQDGSPGGYMRMDLEGKDLSWRYKSINFDEDYQFRIIDLNTVKSYYEHNADAQKFLVAGSDKVGTPDNYTWAADNSILVNVFAMDKNWTVTIEEELDGQWVRVDYIYRATKDPVHNIAYDIPRFLANGEINTGFATSNTVHMLYAELEKLNSRVRVTAVDPFGRQYRQTVERPRALDVNMDDPA